MYILYFSQNGTTKRYAELLSEATGLPCTGAPAEIPFGERVILFGRVTAGKIQGYRYAFRHYDLQAVIAVGLAPTGAQERELRKSNNLRDTTKLFTLQGGYYPDQLQGMEKRIMKLVTGHLIKTLQRKKDLTDADRDLLELLQKGGDRVNRNNLSAVLKWYSGE